MIHILSWTTTLSRPLHSNLKKIQGLFKDFSGKDGYILHGGKPQVHR